MSDNLPDDPLVNLLGRLVENNAALISAVEEIALWLDQQGAPQSLARIHEHLGVVRDNSAAVQQDLAELIGQAALRYEDDISD